MSRHPEVLWAQRSDKLYLTVCLPDAKDIKVKSEPDGKFSFAAKGRNAEFFKLELELFGRINPDESRVDTGLRNICCELQKEEKGWWKRLLKLDERPAPYIKVDWNKWCDEDEEESSTLDPVSSRNLKSELTDDELDEDDDGGMLYLPDLEMARDT